MRDEPSDEQSDENGVHHERPESVVTREDLPECVTSAPGVPGVVTEETTETVGATADAEPLDLSDYDLHRDGREVAVSPDGERVAFVVKEVNRADDRWERSLFVAPTDGSRSPHRLTRLAGAHSPRWSPSGDRLAVLSYRDAHAGLFTPPEPREESLSTDLQVWAFDLRRGGDPDQLTTHPGGVEDFDWGPEGQRLVIEVAEPTSPEPDAPEGAVVIDRLQHKGIVTDPPEEAKSLAVVDLQSGEKRLLDDAYGAGALAPNFGLQPRWSPTSEWIAFFSVRPEDTEGIDDPDDSYVRDIYAIRADGTDCRRLTDGDLTAFDTTWHPDGDRIAFVGREPHDWHRPNDACLTSVSDPGVRRLTAGSDFDRSVGVWKAREADSLAWTGDDELACLVSDAGRTRLARVSAESDGDDAPAWIDTGLADSATIRALDADGGTLALRVTAVDAGPDVHTADAAGVAEGAIERTRVSGVNDEFRAERPTPTARRVAWESSDGTRVEGWLEAPPAFDLDEPEPRPTITVLHAGVTGFRESEADFETSYWTSRGYLVFRPNFRGSRSYGTAFGSAIRGEWNTLEIDDVLTGLDHLEAQGWADPERQFLDGFSRGANAVPALLLRSDRFVCAVAERGTYDYYSAFGTSMLHNWHEDDLGLPWEDEERNRASATLQDVDRIDTPTLVNVCGADKMATSAQGERLYVGLRENGTHAKLTQYRDLPHHMGDPAHERHRLLEVTDWFQRYDPALDR